MRQKQSPKIRILTFQVLHLANGKASLLPAVSVTITGAAMISSSDQLLCICPWTVGDCGLFNPVEGPIPCVSKIPASLPS